MSDYDELLAYEKRSEEKAQEFIKKITAKIPLFIAIGIAIWWLFYGTIKITQSDLTLVERIGMTICTIVLAITYGSLISDGGFRSAYETLDFKTKEKEWEEAVKKGNPYKKEIINYAKEIAKGNVYEIRKENLESYGLKYEQFFDNDGNIKYNFRKDKELTRKQKKIVSKCARIKIVLPTIFGNVSGKFFGVKREVTKKEYEIKTYITKGITKTLISIVSVGVMFEFIGFNIGSLIYALFQIVLWTASGVSQRMKNFNFVLDNLLPQYQEKTLIINGYLDTHKEVIKDGIEN